MVSQLVKDIQYKPGFSGFPTYMIVNRKGEVVYPEAAYPSSGAELLGQIRSVLAK